MQRFKSACDALLAMVSRGWIERRPGPSSLPGCRVRRLAPERVAGRRGCPTREPSRDHRPVPPADGGGLSSARPWTTSVGRPLVTSTKWPASAVSARPLPGGPVPGRGPMSTANIGTRGKVTGDDGRPQQALGAGPEQARVRNCSGTLSSTQSAGVLSSGCWVVRCGPSREVHCQSAISRMSSPWTRM